MSDLKSAEEVLDIVKKKVEQSEFFTGIEIAALRKGDVYTDELCVRVLVNKKNITHSDLEIPTTLKDIPIVIEKRILNPL